MNKYPYIIYFLIIVLGLKSLYAFDNSLNLSKFDEIVHPSTAEENTFNEPDEIVVRFEKDKNTPKFLPSEQVSVDFVNEDIKSVLRYIAELYDLNIVIPTSLSGNVTLRLKDVDWKALLKAVLTPLGYFYIEDNGILQIVSENMSKQEPLQTKTFVLTFADAKTVAEELKDFIDKDAKEKLSFNSRTNILIWTGRSKNLSNIENIIKQLDKPETQVMIEAKFVEATNDASDNRGFKWPSGLNFYWDDAGNGGSADGENDSSSSSSDTHGQLTYGLMGSKFFKGSTMFIQTLQGTFDFSKTDNFGKTLSNPTIITMNNVPASMNVTSNYPVPKYSYNSDNKAYEINGFEEKPIGIELKVTPKIQSKYITLQLEPSLSEQTGSISFSGSSGIAISYPQIKEKKTSSIVTIESGRSIAIGGLMSEIYQDAKTKTPFLSNIPILGNMFSHTNKVKNISNLLIFLSATQIAYDGTIVYPTQVGVKNISNKKMYEMGISDKDLPGEKPATEDEEKKYLEIQMLKEKINNIENQQKIFAEKRKLESDLQIQVNPTRTSKLRKKQNNAQ